MDEITRCLEVLGLKPGASFEETKKSYRELLMVWHPDRFPSDGPLYAKAIEKVKELNAAYEFLTEHGFRDGQPAMRDEPHPTASESKVGEPPQGFEQTFRRTYLWI